MNRASTFLVWLLIGLAPRLASVAGQPSLLAASLKDVTCQGKLVAQDDELCWLMGRDGRLFRLEIDQIQKITSVSPYFRKFTPAELRDNLRREYGRGFDVVGSGHYLVCAGADKAPRYALIFEEIYRSVHLYFSRRGFRIVEPEFPMVAVIFPDQSAFAQQCRKDGVRAGAGLLGYYHPDSNRVALFDTGEESTAAADGRESLPESFAAAFRELNRNDAGMRSLKLHPSRQDAIAARPHAGEIAADLKDTIVHEATHQVAFNIGLHLRIGENPKWIVEGVATAFEVAGMYNASATESAKDRINRGRFVWFTNFVQTRRRPGSLGEFVATDQMFSSATQDAYAQSWALTFFLLETRGGGFSRYLRAIAAHNPLLEYSAEDRLADFRKAFGDDLDHLDAEFLRFMQRLQ